MTRKYLSLAVLALAFSAVCIQPLHADPIATLKVDGALGLLTQLTVAGVQEYIYTDTVTDLADTMQTNFVATYATVAGVQVLNVTDTCIQVTVVLTAPIACQALAFSFTDLAFADLNLVSALGTASVDLTGQLAQINFAAENGSPGLHQSFSPARGDPGAGLARAAQHWAAGNGGSCPAETRNALSNVPPQVPVAPGAESRLYAASTSASIRKQPS
jgi:hypothetical protein